MTSYFFLCVVCLQTERFFFGENCCSLHYIFCKLSYEDHFYQQLQETIDQTPKKDILVVQGDWNAKVGKDAQADWGEVCGPYCNFETNERGLRPGRVAQSVGRLTRKSGVLGSIPGLETYFRFSFRFFKKGSCQLLAKVCARSTGQPLRRSKPAQEMCG